MATPSVSFRISRSTEDLAGTLHLLSQRLVQLEQRLAALEARADQQPQEDPSTVENLDNAERLLLDCRILLEGALQDPLPSGAAAATFSPRNAVDSADPEPADAALDPMHLSAAAPDDGLTRGETGDEGSQAAEATGEEEEPDPLCLLESDDDETLAA